MKTVLRRIRAWNRRTRIGLVLVTVGVGFLGLAFTSRMPLSAGYHDFADKRTILLVPNSLDVLSNLLFVVIGIAGLISLLRRGGTAPFRQPVERIPYIIFFLGVALTGAGSFWYHLAPDSSRLPWDLLPMTLSFMSMVAATLNERIGVRIGMAFYAPLLLLGAGSVLYWYFTEAAGRGDYRFYLFVQFFPPLLLGLIVMLFPPTYSGFGYLVLAFACFVLAKLLEAEDWSIYGAVRLISGHALKHLTAGVACYWVLRMLQVRHIRIGSGLPPSLPTQNTL